MGLFTGPAAATRGLGLLFSGQGLLPLALIPAGVGLVVSLGGMWAAGHYSEDLVNLIWPEPAGWFSHLFWAIFMWIVGIASVSVPLGELRTTSLSPPVAGSKTLWAMPAAFWRPGWGPAMRPSVVNCAMA